MLAKDPSDRYADMAGFLEDIARIQRGVRPRSRISDTVRTLPSKPVLFIPAVFLALAALAAGYLVLRSWNKSATSSAGAARRPSLAVVGFENKSGDRNLDNWRDAFPELLTTDLSQSKFLRVLRSDQLYGIYKKLNLLETAKYTDQDLRDIAGNGGVDHIVKGSYLKAGDQLVITAALIHIRSGETLSSLSLNADGEKAIFSTVDELTREIKVRLNISPSQLAGDIDEEVDIISTDSFEALTHYMKGRHHHYEGDFKESIRSMERALRLYPDNPLANGKLIELCATVEDWDRTIDRLEFIKGKKISSHFDYHYVYIFLCAKGMIEKAVETLHDYLDDIENSWVIRWTLALVYAIPRRFDLALSEIDRAAALAPSAHWILTTKAAIHLFREEFPEVERICDRLIRHKDINAQLDGRKTASLLALLRGKPSDAERHFKEGKAAAEKLGVQWELSRFVSLLGYVHFITGKDAEAAGEFEDEIRIYGESDWEERMIRARYLKALALLPHERPPWERLDDIPQALFIEPLARAYLEAGDLEKAQAEYEKISLMTWGRLFYGDLHALSFYRLGEIYRQKGWEGKAIESYRKFINLWKDCDPVYRPLVEEARTLSFSMKSGS